MKLIGFLFLMLWILPELRGQQVEYIYDAAGNRTTRQVVVLRKSSEKSAEKSAASKSAVADKDKTDASQPEIQAASTPEMYADLLGERKVLIYPNPTQGMIRIEFQEYGDMKDARMLLYDIKGKLLRQVNRVEPSNILDLSQYPAGMYILQMIEGKMKSEWKIIKE